MGAHLDARRRLAGTQDHGDRTALLRVVDMDRQKTALVIVSIEQRQLLVAMRDVAGVVDVERHRRRRLFVGRHPLIDERIGKTDHVAQPGRVLEARQRPVANTDLAPCRAGVRKRV